MGGCRLKTMSLTNTNNLGGPVNGYSAPQTITNFKSSEQVMTRRIVRDSWNTKHANGSYNGKQAVIGPFRRVNNLGDFLGRVNYSCGGPNQTQPSKPGLRNIIGSIPQMCDSTGIEAASTNVKFVSDSSDYMRYKKQTAINNNYNALSNGGEESNASYSAELRIKM